MPPIFLFTLCHAHENYRHRCFSCHYRQPGFGIVSSSQAAGRRPIRKDRASTELSYRLVFAVVYLVVHCLCNRPASTTWHRRRNTTNSFRERGKPETIVRAFRQKKKRDPPGSRFFNAICRFTLNKQTRTSPTTRRRRSANTKRPLRKRSDFPA